MFLLELAPTDWMIRFRGTMSLIPKGRDTREEALIFNAEPHRPISGALSWLAAQGKDEEQTDGLVTTEAIELLEAHQALAFFLGVGYYRPHTPYVAPKSILSFILWRKFNCPNFR